LDQRLDQSLCDGRVSDDEKTIIQREHVHKKRVGLVEGVPDLDEAIIRMSV
jgi:hypothetical protein